MSNSSEIKRPKDKRGNIPVNYTTEEMIEKIQKAREYGRNYQRLRYQEEKAQRQMVKDVMKGKAKVVYLETVVIEHDKKPEEKIEIETKTENIEKVKEPEKKDTVKPFISKLKGIKKF